ncbi:MAG: 2-oxoacid:acceptor oxidoreductase subunit alpha [Planctomycetes bacterium]|nr:2-oxoacid:acceptor oxidoreductase subunit alpha [Planctomycetota bacterium]
MRGKRRLAVLDARCKGCGICVPVCKTSALTLEGPKIRLDEEKCNACGLCTFSCPDFALTIHGAEGKARSERLPAALPPRGAIPQPAPGLHFMQGATACSEGALAAGCRFYAGYPITPSTEVAEEMAARLPQVGGRFIQLEDEIASMGAIAGASLSGVKSMTATSGPGFSLMQENLGAACMREIPVVVVNVMRGGPCTGLPTRPAQGDVMQARWGTHGDHQIIALVPWSVEEMFRLTVRAFNLAERYRTPVLLLPDEITAHMRERILLPDYATVQVVDRLAPTVAPEKFAPFDAAYAAAPLPAYGRGYRFHVTGLAHRADGFPTGEAAAAAALLDRLERKILDARADIEEVDETAIADAETVVVAYGSTARSARQAVMAARTRGRRVGLFRPVTLWPFPTDRLIALADRGVRQFVMVEANRGQIVGEVERAVGRRSVRAVLQADGNPIMSRTIEQALA